MALSIQGQGWNMRAAAAEGDIPEDELAELDPAAYDALLAQKARKKEQEAAANDFEEHRQKVKAEERQREEMTQVEAALTRAEQWANEKTTYGGLQMTRAEAQENRQYAVDHEDEIVAWGMQTGHFSSEAQGRHFIANEKLLHALDAADQAGTMTEAQRAQRSRVDQEQTSFASTQVHINEQRERERLKIVAPSRAVSVSAPLAAQPLADILGPRIGPPGSSANDDNPFRERAPDLLASFATKANPTQTPQPEERLAVAPIPMAVQTPTLAAGFAAQANPIQAPQPEEKVIIAPVRIASAQPLISSGMS